jgi:hypothetical protein
VRPAVTINALRPFSAEAVRRFKLGLAPDDLSRFVLEHENDPPREEVGSLYFAYHRVWSAWILWCDKQDAADAMTKGFPFHGYEISTVHGCASAAERFNGLMFREPGDLPDLPLPDCSSPWCKCHYSGVTEWRVRRRP